jgi:hypothetical protein
LIAIIYRANIHIRISVTYPNHDARPLGSPFLVDSAGERKHNQLSKFSNISEIFHHHGKTSEVMKTCHSPLGLP